MTDSSKTDAAKKTTRAPGRKAAAAKASTVGRRSEAEDGSGATGGAQAITIKKYANRRLYNTATSSYVTLDHLCQMVKDGVEFVVYDAKTGEDITRAVLTQIIVEEESKGQNLLPIGFLRQLISFYGDNLQMVVPGYLESSMAAFSQNQERMRSYMSEAFGGMYPFGSIEDMTKRNLTMLEQAMSMFTPPGGTATGGGAKPAPSSAEPASGGSGEDTAAAVRQLQTQLETLQRQLMELGTGALSKRDTDDS
ncbi:polyhydroxyalkanoate synthesis repressor PhaR [Thalassobaculum litoreum]|uniref:Polyhydroxyalkanoate synthesis repressor PhaR n=1 Tax=Thalassobaculum litoreum DSM 18839 TaxID=1123362 RepID=A0A8G2EVM7_9PROT|nr:polyhydroxyalkanoate synthesis repressor PhaR [Thalassobaculum litoreum]SDF38083.1 polyhydroxyalkanoate synthesis repressor PhaR [Thalassobaculum litoreum DSM 18839]